jgi:anti-anti-sigma factor
MRHSSGAASVEPGGVFSCSVSRVSDHVTVGVIGQVDQAAAGQFRNQLLTLAKEHPAVIVIDLTGVSLADTACVAVLVEAWRFAQDHGIELTVRSPSDAITRTFDVTASGRLLTLRT